MYVYNRVIHVVHRSMADGHHGAPCPTVLPRAALVSKHVYDNATTLRMVIILVSHKEITLILGLKMVAPLAKAIILNCLHVTWKNVQLELVIDAIQNAKNMDNGRVKRFFLPRFQVVQRTNVFYIVENQVKLHMIQIVMFQLVRLQEKYSFSLKKMIDFKDFDGTFRYIVQLRRSPFILYTPRV